MATTFSVNFGGTRKLSASPLTPIYYDEEFSNEKKDADFLEDYLSVASSLQKNMSVNSIKLMRIIWACEKTYKNGIIENFNAWVRMLSSAKFNNQELYIELAGAIQSEFFLDEKQQETTKDEEKDEVIN